MENEIMNYEEEVMEPEVEVEPDEKNSCMGTGAAMLIGAGLTIAATAVIKFGKKLYAKHKAKKQQKAEDDYEEACSEEFDEATK